MLTLKVGDVYHNVFSHSLTEIKIGADVTDYARLIDELQRMNQLAYETVGLQLHLLYCDTKDHIMSFQEYKTLVHLCVEYGVFPHHCYTMEELIEKQKDICEDKYTNRLYAKPPPKNINPFAKMLCGYSGMSPTNAVTISEICPIPNKLGHAIKEGLLDEVFGVKTGLKVRGESKQIAIDFEKFWLEGII